MRRAILILAVLCLTLLLLAPIVITIVINTDLPRSIVRDALQDQTGLRVEIAGLSTGWGGTTNVEGIKLTLPLETEPFATVDALELSHTGLFWLIVQEPFEIEYAKLDGANVVAAQRPTGRWNLQDAADIVSRSLQRKEDSESDGPISELPEVSVDDLRLSVQRYEADAAAYAPIRFAGTPDGPHRWRYELAVADAANIDGRLNPRDPGGAELNFDLIDIRYLLTPWTDKAGLASLPQPMSVTGMWRGDINESGFQGLLSFAEIVAGEITGHGATRIASESYDAVLIEPRTLTAKGGPLPEPIMIDGGSFEISAEQSRVRDVTIESLDHNLLVNSTYEFETNRFEGDAIVRGIVESEQLRTQGRVSFDGRVPDGRAIFVNARIDMESSMAAGEIKLVGDATVDAAAWNDVKASLSFPDLVWSDSEGEIDMSGLSADIAYAAPNVSLRRLELPNAERVDANAEYAVDTNKWSVNVDALQWPIPRLIPEPVDVALTAEGDLDRIDFSRLNVNNERVSLRSSGSYLPKNETPLTAKARLKLTNPLDDGADGVLPADAVAASDEDELPDHSVEAALDVTGALEPLDVKYSGQVTAKTFPVAAGVLDQVVMPWRGVVTEEQATFESEPFDLLEGRWTLDGVYDMEHRSLVASVDGQSMPLERLIDLFGAPIEAAGALTLNVDLHAPTMTLDDLEIDGEWSIVDLQRGAFAARTGRGKFETRNGEIVLSDARLESNGGLLEGGARFNLDQRDRLLVDVQADKWRLDVENSAAAMLATGDLELEITFPANDAVVTKDAVNAAADSPAVDAEGDFDLVVDLLFGGEPIGTADFDGRVDDRVVDVKNILVRIFDGEMRGRAHVPFDDLLQTNVDLVVDNLDLGAAAQFNQNFMRDQLDALRGKADGYVRVGPSERERAQEKLEIDVNLDLIDADWREADLEKLELLAFAGEKRVVVDRLALTGIGGSVEIWAQSSNHGDDTYGHAVATITDIDLNQVAHIVDPTFDPLPGIINGKLSFGGYRDEPHRLFGGGELRLTNSDLGALPAFSTLYSALRLNFGKTEPQGFGKVVLQLENDRLLIRRLEYFNRGTDVVGSLDVMQIWDGGDSPIQGVAVGTVRPFRELDLPLAASLDRMVQAIQSDAVSVKIDGTLAERNIKVVPLVDLGTGLKRLLSSGEEPTAAPK